MREKIFCIRNSSFLLTTWTSNVFELITIYFFVIKQTSNVYHGYYHFSNPPVLMYSYIYQLIIEFYVSKVTTMPVSSKLFFFFFFYLSIVDLQCYVMLPQIGATAKEPACQSRRQKRHGFDPWVGKIIWRRVWQPIPVFLPGESHG